MENNRSFYFDHHSAESTVKNEMRKLVFIPMDNDDDQMFAQFPCNNNNSTHGHHNLNHQSNRYSIEEILGLKPTLDKFESKHPHCNDNPHYGHHTNHRVFIDSDRDRDDTAGHRTN
ncbi:hypothetical protein BLA29_004095 [Euroglyphus maynei]|uniref:Uncharacterized protein n=1 Tax=Euroglyphus maynei TaxID=6958 RepID=A0A1Y3B5K8_EURMA|nr:hypothetical protein BLA29_004095 [Euroglyphus maynei]